MALIEQEVVAAIAATAAVVSPKARKAARTGLVYGLAGVFKAGDVAVAAARGFVDGAKGPPDAGAEKPPTRPRATRSSASARQRRGGRSGTASGGAGGRP